MEQVRPQVCGAKYKGLFPGFHCYRPVSFPSCLLSLAQNQAGLFSNAGVQQLQRGVQFSWSTLNK